MTTMEGTGGVRRFEARWVLEADLVAMQSLHLGSGESGTDVDLLLARDARDGGPLLTGDSLAGGLRDHACRRLLGNRAAEASGRSAERAAIERVFGGTREDPGGEQSSLIVFDSWTADQGSELRYGNRHDATTGLVDEHALYTMETWPAGTTFPVRLDLLVPEGTTEREETELLATLALALGGIDTGHVRVGAKGRRGYGRCQIQRVRAKRYALNSRAGWEAWLRAAGRRLLEHQKPAASVFGALESSGLRVAERCGELQAQNPLRELVVTVPVWFKAGLLIGSPPTNAAMGADRQHLRSGVQPVVSGTALAGPMRLCGRRIASSLCASRESADRWVAALFGAVHAASHVFVEEVHVHEAVPLQVTRIQLDQWTQAPMSGALLEEAPVYGGRASLEFRVELPDDEKVATRLQGFFLLIVKELLLENLPIGATTGVGRGIAAPDPRQGPPVIRLGDTVLDATELAARVNEWVKAFGEAAGSGPSSPEAGGAA
jgi:CRISPR/Cas system CSM-associated protein Csm3 (group 7 of RAMP superfamily)